MEWFLLQKKENISNAIVECGSDTKALYKIVNNIIIRCEKRKLITIQCNRQGSCRGICRFLSWKIEKIIEGLKHINLYTLYDQVDVKLYVCVPVSEEDIRKTIMTMPTKSCELDILPANILQKVLAKYVPFITKIINLSLSQGVFVSKWKAAIVRPLLKKSVLELISSNYRPVSNFSPLSKLLEKVALQQFMNHYK